MEGRYGWLYVLASTGGNPPGHKTTPASWIVFGVIIVILLGISWYRRGRQK